MNTEHILDQAKTEGTLIGSLVVAGGLERMAPAIGDATLKIIRGVVLASVGLRMVELATGGATESQQIAYRELAMEIFDGIVAGWLERCRHAGPLH